MKQKIIGDLELLLQSLNTTEAKVDVINELKLLLHRYSPFGDEPVDCVLWLKSSDVVANDYNPNTMAPAEKRLLKHSLESDGFTQPLVSAKTDDKYVLIDGYHRYQIGKKNLSGRLNGYLPVVIVKSEKTSLAQKIASTVRHNRARGKHAITSMSEIVRDLVRLGWSDKRISTELGMEEDEILRLKQISGLSELFAGEKFSEAWTVK